MFEPLRDTTHTSREWAVSAVIIAVVMAAWAPAAWADGMIVPVDPAIAVIRQFTWAQAKARYVTSFREDSPDE